MTDWNDFLRSVTVFFYHLHLCKVVLFLNYKVTFITMEVIMNVRKLFIIFVPMLFSFGCFYPIDAFSGKSDKLFPMDGFFGKSDELFDFMKRQDELFKELKNNKARNRLDYNSVEYCDGIYSEVLYINGKHFELKIEKVDPKIDNNSKFRVTLADNEKKVTFGFSGSMEELVNQFHLFIKKAATEQSYDLAEFAKSKSTDITGIVERNKKVCFENRGTL